MKTYFEKINEKISENKKVEIIEKFNNEFGENDFCHFISSLTELNEFVLHTQINEFKIKHFLKTGKWLSYKFLFLNLNDYDLGYKVFDNRIPAMKAFREEYAYLCDMEDNETEELIDNNKNAEYNVVDYEDWDYRGIVLPILSDDKYVIAGFDQSIGKFCLWSGSKGKPIKKEKDIKVGLLDITGNGEYTNEIISHFINDGETIETTDVGGNTLYLRLIEVC